MNKNKLTWDWQYNVREGKIIFDECYQTASDFANNNPGAYQDEEHIVRDAYYRYNHGIMHNLYNSDGEIRNAPDEPGHEDAVEHSENYMNNYNNKPWNSDGFKQEKGRCIGGAQ
jgi:hypothetical protein